MSKIITVRVSDEVAEYYKGKNVREILERLYKRREVDEKLTEIEFLYEIGANNLLSNVRWLLDSKKLFVKEGKLYWNPRYVDEDFFSVDDVIEKLNASGRDKLAIKRKIVQNIENIGTGDDLGNGGGL